MLETFQYLKFNVFTTSLDHRFTDHFDQKIKNLLFHWLQAQELANKDAAYKEIQIKLEAMEQHCEVQQQLLQHACNLEYGTGYMNIDDEASPSSSNNDTNTIAENTTYVVSSFET